MPLPSLLLTTLTSRRPWAGFRNQCPPRSLGWEISMPVLFLSWVYRLAFRHCRFRKLWYTSHLPPSPPGMKDVPDLPLGQAVASSELWSHHAYILLFSRHSSSWSLPFWSIHAAVGQTNPTGTCILPPSPRTLSHRSLTFKKSVDHSGKRADLWRYIPDEVLGE